MTASNMSSMAMLYPQGVADQAGIDQQRALAQAILSQGMQPMQSNAMAGNVAYHVSPMEGLANMLKTWTGVKMQQDANDKQQDLAQRYAQAIKQRFSPTTQQVSPQDPQVQDAVQRSAYTQNFLSGGNAGLGQGQNNDQNTQAIANGMNTDGTSQKLAQALTQYGQQQNQSNNPWVLPGMSPQDSATMFAMAPDKYWEAKAQNAAMTPEMKVAASLYGFGTPQFQSAMERINLKNGYTAPTSLRPGAPYIDPASGQVKYTMPAPPAGYQYDSNNNLQPIPGALNAITESRAAEKKADAQFNMHQVFNPATGAYEWQSEQNIANAANGVSAPTNGAPPAGFTPAPGNGYSGGSPGAADSTSFKLLQQELANAKAHGATQEAAAIQNEINKRFPALATQGQQAAPKPMMSAPPLGANQGAVNSQNNMAADWKELSSQNSQAQNTVSSLQNIKQYAQKAAVGSLSDKLNYANGLLSMVGVKGATDAKTANDLLAKNANQIAMRLGGSGGMSTDAGRALIQAAFPNAHMSLPAINEAADNLIASSQMTQAKAQYLLDPYNGNNAQAYNQRKQVFEQYADPRVWQLANMPPEQRDTWLRKQPDAADLYSKVKVARSNGWAKI